MIKWGIIGLGNIAWRFVQSIQYADRACIEAIASHNQEKQNKFKAVLHHVKVYDDYETLIRSDVDAIYIALPHGMHYHYAKMALLCHKHVLVEKPSTLSYQDTKELIALAHQNQVFFMEVLKTRFIAFNQQIKDEVNKGTIGQVIKVQASFCNDVLDNKRPGWYLLDPIQGGALYDVGPYPISFVMDFLGDKYQSIQSHYRIKEGIVHYFYSELDYGNAKGIVEGAIDENKERMGYIYGTLGRIEIPMYNRPIEYTVYLNDGQSYHYHQDLLFDDMYDEIKKANDGIMNKDDDIQEWSHQDSLSLMKIIEDIKESFH